jgi:hypothetical protein
MAAKRNDAEPGGCRNHPRANGSNCQIVSGGPFDAHLKSLHQARAEAARLSPDHTTRDRRRSVAVRTLRKFPPVRA